MEDVRKLVGSNVARIRKSKGLTQEALEGMSGCSQAYISALEQGSRNPTILVLVMLARALGVPVFDLLAGVETAKAARPKATPKKKG